jgi:hypothetical protein
LSRAAESVGVSRSLALPTALALLALLAGCATGPGTGPTTTAPTTAPSTTTDTSTTPVTETTTVPSRTGTDGCPYYVTVEPATDGQVEQAETVLAYANLSAARQSEFDAALANRNGTTTLETLPETWSRPRVVEKNGTLYATVASTC